MAGRAIISINEKEWQVDVAVTPWELEQGLGGLPELAAGTGMLFDLGMGKIIQVTTVPMLFSLDIAFLSEELKVAEVYNNVGTGYLVTSSQPVHYFIEVNAGDFEGIAPGDTASVDFLPFEEMPVASDWLSMIFNLAGFLVLGTLTVSIIRDFTRQALEEPEAKPGFLPQVQSRRPQSYYELEMDRMGNIILTRSDDSGKDVFLQFESDKDLIYDLLRKAEKRDLEAGWEIRIKRSEPRASILDELWANFAQPKKESSSLYPPAVILEQSRKPVYKSDLEFLPDSPEFLAYTIDDIGYRDKIDSAFLSAIARARGKCS